MAGYNKRIGMGVELNANGKDQLMGEETKTRNSISLPRGIVMLCAVAILCVIADLIGGLIEYFQNDTLRIVRIIIRCFTILGWSAVEWYIVSELWETRKKKKNTIIPHIMYPETQFWVHDNLNKIKIEQICQTTIHS